MGVEVEGGRGWTGWSRGVERVECRGEWKGGGERVEWRGWRGWRGWS